MAMEVDDGKSDSKCRCCCPCTPKKVIIHSCIVILIITAILLGILLALCKKASDTFVETTTCRHKVNLPSNFSSLHYCETYTNVDFSEYFTNDYLEVSFKSRDKDEDLDLNGWYFKNSTSAPIIIMTHGFDSCRNQYNTLAPALMLRRNGFNVLTYDLRNHGDSAKSKNPYVTWGINEHKDLLGAIDYARIIDGGRNDSRIALFGSSMAGRISSIAFGIEQNIKAIWLDSAVFLPREVFEDGITNAGFPGSLAIGGWMFNERKTGVDMDGFAPENAYIYKDRKVYISHSTKDDKAPIDQAEQYKALAEKTAPVTTWFVDTLGDKVRGKSCREHVVFAAFDPKEYEKRLTEFFKSVFN